MAIGINPDAYVWVIDPQAGTAYPAPKDSPLIKADPERYEVDTKHPVTDHRGALLDTKPVGPKADPKIKPAAAGKEN